MFRECFKKWLFKNEFLEMIQPIKEKQEELEKRMDLYQNLFLQVRMDMGNGSKITQIVQLEEGQKRLEERWLNTFSEITQLKEGQKRLDERMDSYKNKNLLFQADTDNSYRIEELTIKINKIEAKLLRFKQKVNYLLRKEEKDV